MDDRKRLGAFLIERGVISETTLMRVLEKSEKVLHKKVGFVLEDMGLITGKELAEALASQFGYKTVETFARFHFPPELLRLVPLDMAMHNMLFPLKIVKGKLALALADPTENKLISNLAANNGLNIMPLIATRKDIVAAINRHYLGKDSSETKGKTVMIVDENRELILYMKSILVRDGYRVVAATEGMIAYRAAIADPPHVILTDNEIPKLNGFGLFDALKNLPETTHIPFILHTENLTGEDEERAFEKGFFDFLAKPVGEATLKIRVKRAYNYISQQYGFY